MLLTWEDRPPCDRFRGVPRAHAALFLSKTGPALWADLRIRGHLQSQRFSPAISAPEARWRAFGSIDAPLPVRTGDQSLTGRNSRPKPRLQLPYFRCMFKRSLI